MPERSAAPRQQSPTRAEFVITELPRGREAPLAIFKRIAAHLLAEKVEVVAAMIYASGAGRQEVTDAFVSVFGPAPWPMTWVEAGVCDGGPLAGVQVFAIRSSEVSRLTASGRPIGSVYRVGPVRLCHLAGVLPNDRAATARSQVETTLAEAERALCGAGFAYSDIFRTWFYNDDIVAWYRPFNEARSAHYAGQPWRGGAVPASTGIGAGNPAGAKLSFSGLAVQPVEGHTECDVRAVSSPGQCSALVYGSSFSRAMEVAYAGLRRLYISGTASIHPDGSTAWVGNPTKQIELTMDVVGGILESRGLRFDSITRATAYFKDARFKPCFDAWLVRRGLERMPVVSIEVEVCRAELLFEIEVDAEADL